MVNQNRASNSVDSVECIAEGSVEFARMKYSNPGYGDDPNPSTAEIAGLLRLANRRQTKYEGDIFTDVYFPLYDNFTVNRTIVGVMRIVIHWARYFEHVLPTSTRGVIFVLENDDCDEPFTYRIDGEKVTPLGHGDLHDTAYDEYERTATLRNMKSIPDGTAQGIPLHQIDGECPYSIRVYPSTAFYKEYSTNTPHLLTFAVACVFLFTFIMFFLYDYLVERRQRILMKKATQTHQIVASLFPKNVRDRLLQDDNDKKKEGGLMVPNNRLKKFLNGDEGNNQMGQAPIADLFPHSTILFADIAGFTAWSSSREPAQVFILLQSVYQAFDQIAKRRKVFKVETIADSVSDAKLWTCFC
jgi:hypothetical protein